MIPPATLLVSVFATLTLVAYLPYIGLVVSGWVYRFRNRKVKP